MHYRLAAVSLALVVAIIGFLRYNLAPAKIVMGNAGSLLIGLISKGNLHFGETGTNSYLTKC